MACEEAYYIASAYRLSLNAPSYMFQVCHRHLNMLLSQLIYAIYRQSKLQHDMYGSHLNVHTWHR